MGSLDAAIQEAIQHPARCSILQACMAAPVSVRDIIAATGVPSVSCYRHLHALVDAGLVAVVRSALSPEGRPYDLYRATIEEATLTVRATGIRAGHRVHTAMKDRLHRLWSHFEERP